MVGRIGIAYDNMSAVKDKREQGELPPVNQGLRGEQIFESPCIILNPKNGRRYLRLYKGISDKTQPKVQYRIGDAVVSRESVEHMMLANELSASHGDCFQVNVANLRRVHAEVAEDTEIAETPQEVEDMGIRFAKDAEVASLQAAIAKLQGEIALLGD